MRAVSILAFSVLTLVSVTPVRAQVPADVPRPMVKPVPAISGPEIAYIARSASFGDPRSQFKLGELLQTGRGVARDRELALVWIRKSAAQGFAEAEETVGVAYYFGFNAPKDPAMAATWFRKAADQGEGASRFYLASQYYHGWGVAQDYVQAYKWFALGKTTKTSLFGSGLINELSEISAKMTPAQIAEAQALVEAWTRPPLTPDQQATAVLEIFESGKYAEAVKILTPLAESGHARAQFQFGYLYEAGLGVAQDSAVAAGWYRKAAEQGHPMAQAALGAMYLEGKGVPKEYLTAETWLRKAADQGIFIAQYRLGNMYMDGREVPQNATAAMSWLRKSAAQGFADAQFAVGLLSFRGTGQPADPIDGYMWISLAPAYGLNPKYQAMAAQAKADMAAQMTPEQVAEAEKRADAWAPTLPKP